MSRHAPTQEPIPPSWMSSNVTRDEMTGTGIIGVTGVDLGL